MRVTLLGTGCPVADVHRYGPATLVEAGGETWLIDCGSGVTQRLLAHGSNGAKLTGLLLTHLHSDHVVDFIQLLISGWHQGRAKPLRVYGPRRTREFLGALLEAWRPEFEQRTAHERRGGEGLRVELEEIDGGWTLETPGLRIRNVEVRHPPIPQAFGYRFEERGEDAGTATVSGDTAYCPELIELARGSDLLVHEAFVHWQYAKRQPDPAKQQAMRSYHTATEEVGKVAREAGVGHLALTHWVPLVFDRARVVEDVRTEFHGGLTLGEDLMSFDVVRGHVALARSGVQSHL
ncbi:MAG: MBL fold metallo-hydrolase [Planctomycetota bacterium]|nr:MBL fold metallo-hydrolase [Planctomycetota bacterium]